MANYRIKIERLNDEVEIDNKFVNGMEVNGFVLLADVDDEECLYSINHMSIEGIAQAMYGSRPIIEAAQLAKLFRDCKDIIGED